MPVNTRPIVLKMQFSKTPDLVGMDIAYAEHTIFKKFVCHLFEYQSQFYISKSFY